ncbi:7033_t:CDS:1, partial [Gigaspora rosea]
LTENGVEVAIPIYWRSKLAIKIYNFIIGPLLVCNDCLYLIRPEPFTQ